LFGGAEALDEASTTAWALPLFWPDDSIKKIKKKVKHKHNKKKKISWCKSMIPCIIRNTFFSDRYFLHRACAFCGFLLVREATLPGRSSHPEKISFLC
jgi:hypothetical protein